MAFSVQAGKQIFSSAPAWRWSHLLTPYSELGNDKCGVVTRNWCMGDAPMN